MSRFDAHDDYNNSLLTQGAWSVIYRWLAKPRRLKSYADIISWPAWCPGGYPMLKLCPYVLGFQPERSADGHEGEEPARVIAEKPILSLPRALNKPLLRLELFMKAEKGIFEHGVHQRRLRAHDRQPDPRVEELFRRRDHHGHL